jgi:hypothetical protein
MKKLGLLLTILLSLSIVSCKKKSTESAAAGSKNTEAASASAEKDLGFKPSAIISINLPSIMKSDAYIMFKGKIEKDLAKDLPCAKAFISKIKNIVVLADEDMIGKKKSKGKKDGKVYVAIQGLNFDEMMKCVKTSKKAKIKPGKLNGKPAFFVKEEGEEGAYMFKGDGDTIIVVSKKLSTKVTPGEGTFGKGDVSSFASSKSIVFNMAKLEDDVTDAKGYVDLANGLVVKFEGNFTDTAKLDKQMKEYEKYKKNPKALPIPGLDKYLKGISISRKGSKVNVSVKLSKAQVKELLQMAKAFGGNM